MIVTKILSDQIIHYWEYIKFAAVSANGLMDVDYKEEYCRGLLCNLLSSKSQCWVGISNDREQIKGVAITKIYKDAGNIPHLLLDSLYVYSITNTNERHYFMNTIKEFANNIKCVDIIFYTSNLNLIKVAERMGFTSLYNVYKLNLGE